MIGPEPQGRQEVVSDFPVVPVQVRLLTREDVEIPLPIPHRLPGRATENTPPVRWRLLPFLAGAISKDVPVTRRRPGSGVEIPTEPGVPVRGVVETDVHQ